MRFVLTVAMIALLLGMGSATAQTVQSGDLIMDLSQYTPAQNGNPFSTRGNILVNAGFETGSLPPWTTTGWTVTDQDAYAGMYSAESYGNINIRQDFAPVPVADVNSVSMWSKQPEGIAFQAVDLYYGPTDYDEFLVAPGVDWTFINMTGQLRPVGMLQGIRIWGYSGGGPDPDLTRVDEVIIDVEGMTAVPTDTWGQIKALYR